MRDVKLGRRGLTCLYHTDWMVLLTSLDLSQNSLVSVQCLSDLQCLRRLNLNDNLLADLKGLGHCRRLADLSIKNNCILCYILNFNAQFCISSYWKLPAQGNWRNVVTRVSSYYMICIASLTSIQLYVVSKHSES